MPSEVTTSSTAPAAPDPAVIPDDLAEIDEEYVQAVVDELFAVDAKAGEIFIRTREPLNQEAIDYLEAIYTEEEVERQLDIWFQDLALRHDELRPGTLRNEVQEVIDVARDCVYVRVLRDYSETTIRAGEPRTIYVGLTPKRQHDDPNGWNSTAWTLFMDGLNLDGSQPENPCEGR